MTLSLPVAAGLILQAGYGEFVYEVDLTHFSKLRKSMGMLWWLVISYNHTMLLLKVSKHAYDSVFFSFFSVL
jgi:hypothetical protein